jgi:hypothetical protein
VRAYGHTVAEDKLRDEAARHVGSIFDRDLALVDGRLLFAIALAVAAGTRTEDGKEGLKWSAM